ncbi:expansin EXLX1 family cellulose-binding protein [Streptomyces sp. NPDC047000]|uniref:expansin EXLX1 family cellulose-binding protein n=1 Tax=Streptomyces sp. NPDC047000 TaxID=3155474 RepID=UPI0034095E58
MSARRRAARGPRRRPTATAAALTTAGVLVLLVVALLPGGDREGGSGHTAATAVAEAPVTPSTAAPGTPGTTAAATPRAGATKKPGTSASPRPARTSAPASAPARASAGSTARAASGSAPLAGRIRPGTTYRGVATFYDTDGTGACLFDASGDVMTGAMNTADYESSKACGAYVLVRAANGAAVTVRITNECPGDCASGQIDLSAQAFAKLAAPSAGRVPITWRLLSPATSQTVSLRYKTGSTAYWCGLQVIGHRNPVARLELRTSAGGWRVLPRADYDYFLAEDGGGCGGAVRITDIYGERLTVAALPVRANAVQATGVQFARH